eukprot:m.18276 g.18276  ORF g.18276 m.18276 type:complete len:369 (+) comp7766_c0_seq1:408-1514(+)
MAFASSSSNVISQLPRRLSTTASASAERFRTLARNTSTPTSPAFGDNSPESTAADLTGSPSLSYLLSSSSFDAFAGEDLGNLLETDPSLFVLSSGELSHLATGLQATSPASTAIAAPATSPACDPLALDTSPDYSDVWLNAAFSSGLSISGEPAPKAARTKTLPSLTSLLSFGGGPSTTSASGNSFGRLFSALIQQPTQTKSPSSTSTSTSSASTQLSFVLGNEPAAPAFDDEKPTDMLLHDPLLLERLGNQVTPKVPRTSAPPASTAGKATPKASSSKSKKSPIFKFRETAEQRKKRYADTEQVNTMLKQSIRDAQDAVNNTIDLLLLLEQDGKLRLTGQTTAQPPPPAQPSLVFEPCVTLPPPLHL